MNILMVNGSPRSGGNTDILLAELRRGIAHCGFSAELVKLAELGYAPCSGCGYCETEGRCIIEDDMQPLYEKIVLAQRIIIGSPIYFYGVTAQTKAFVDRCQVFWSRKYILGETRHGQAERRGYMVSVAATGGEKCFDSARLTLRYAYDAMDFLYGGEVVVQGVDQRGQVREKKAELEAAFQLGLKVCGVAA